MQRTTYVVALIRDVLSCNYCRMIHLWACDRCAQTECRPVPNRIVHLGPFNYQRPRLLASSFVKRGGPDRILSPPRKAQRNKRAFCRGPRLPRRRKLKRAAGRAAKKRRKGSNGNGIHKHEVETPEKGGDSHSRDFIAAGAGFLLIRRRRGPAVPALGRSRGGFIGGPAFLEEMQAEKAHLCVLSKFRNAGPSWARQLTCKSRYWLVRTEQRGGARLEET